MPIRRLNYTGRRRLAERDIEVRVQETETGLWFDAGLDLEEYRLPAEARVFVEAYRQHSWMRFDYGTVGSIRPPRERYLTEFASPEGILFRVKVVRTDEPAGLLVAEARAVKPEFSEEENEERVCILPVRSDPGLEHEVFRMEFGDRPTLLVSQRIGDWRELVRRPAFAALAYPTVLKEILTRVLLVEEYFDTDDPHDWRSEWLVYATGLPGTGPVPHEEDVDLLCDWVETAVTSFCRHFGIMDRFGQYWTGGDEE